MTDLRFERHAQLDDRAVSNVFVRSPSSAEHARGFGRLHGAQH
jgi:hypothetical protein